MWVRDQGISELVAYFEAIPDAHRHVRYLKLSEINVIRGELSRCQENFEYAARNYFWITTKGGEDVPFQLWEGQMLVLEKYYELRNKYISHNESRAVKVMLLKARQLGCSTLVEGMLAWMAFFTPNRTCLVVSDRSNKAEDLFSKMAHIYDRLPWWMKPMKDKFSYKEGMHLQNPDADRRNDDPGLNSRVWVAAATQEGVGQGQTLHGVHISEYASFPASRAKAIIEGDMVNAIVESPSSFAFLESTGKGAGTYAHKLWRGMVTLGEKAKWVPVFLPSFFEKTRVMAPPDGWKVERQEEGIRRRAFREWVRCDNETCGKYANHFYRGESRLGMVCPECERGKLQALLLADEQLYWIEYNRVNAEQGGLEALKEFKQEQAVTAEDSFQISGVEVFPYVAQAWVDQTIIDPAPKVGFLDSRGQFHGQRPRGGCWAEGCTADHSGDETPLQLWEDPIPGEQYSIGADVAEGRGGAGDYSVAFINRIGRGANADTQAGLFRSNTVDPINFAEILSFLGNWFNEALLCIEYNFMDTCANWVRHQLLYPNLYRWKHLDSITHILADKFHWYTQANTRPRLHQTAVRWLRGQMWVIRSANFRAEMSTFQKDEDDDRPKGQAAKGFHDDEIMGGCIALYCAHEGEWNENLGCIPLQSQLKGPGEAAYCMECDRCAHQWGEDTPEKIRSVDENGNGCCPACKCIRYHGRPNSESRSTGPEWKELWDDRDGIPMENETFTSYDRL